VSFGTQVVSAVRRLGIIVAIGFTFLFGVVSTVYLSLRSPEVKVPEVVGKDRFEAEQVLGEAGLNFRIRATRPSRQSNPDTVLFQLPRAGEVVKVGQTVAMDISRVAKEGEAAESEATDQKVAQEQANDNKSAFEANENRPKRNKNANKNGNDNANGNVNANATTVANRNANVNANRSENANASTPNKNVNKALDEGELKPGKNVNQEPERPRQVASPRPVTPKPSPAARNTNNR
jgi:beta-lactam-binding protein with PASTA domain